MKQLTGLDASFLYMETATTFGHVNGLAIYQRPSEDFDPLEAVRKRMDSVVGHLAPMRRRLVQVPFGLDHPYWADDPDFDLDFHVRHIGLAPPGAADQLAEQVARIVGRPMDRKHPLWEVYVIEGLADGRWALLSKTHHSTIDGASGVMFLELLTDTEPDAEPKFQPIEWEGEDIPSDVALLTATIKNLAANPIKSARLQLRLVGALADAAGVQGVSDAVDQARTALKNVVTRGEDHRPDNERRSIIPLTPAPPTPWNKAITPHRRFAMRSASMENIKALKNATGGTVNDVVMAICAGALRSYLIKHDALPSEPLRAMVPVSIRTGSEDDPWTNRVSSIVADLPTNVGDPLERVRLCHEAMQVAKANFDLIPADTMVDVAQFSSPVIAASATRLASRLRLANIVNTPINLVISNVPGPRQTLYLEGAELDAYMPVSIVTEGVGLNITVHSYKDRLDFGLISDRELVPDLWDLVDLCMEEVEVLFKAADLEPPRPLAIAAMRRGDARVAAIPRRTAEQAGRIEKDLSEATKKAERVAAPAAKKRTAKKAAAKKAPAKKKAAAKKATKKRPAAKKKATASKTVKKKATAKKTAAKKTAAKKTAAKKTAAKKKS